VLAVCVSSRCFNDGSDSLVFSVEDTELVSIFRLITGDTPIRADTSRARVVPVCNTDLALPTTPHTASVDRGRTASQTGQWPW
jgi:hypothetical protein